MADIDLSTEITVGSITLATMGLTHGLFYYAPFGINIFDYMAASDFIIMSFKEPGTLIAALLLCTPLYFSFRFWSRLKENRALQLLLLWFFASAIAGARAHNAAHAVLADQGRTLSEHPCTITFNRGGNEYSISNLVPLGTVSDFLIYYHPDEQATYVESKRVIISVSCATET